MHEKKLESLEEARTAALEMAKEEDEAPKEGAEDAQAVVHDLSRFVSRSMGVWGNTVSSRAPVTGMITNGYSEGPGDVQAR
jgi:hypothetical protein